MDKKAKTASRAVRVVLFFSFLAIIYAALDYLLVDDSSSRSRITMHDLYETDSIDTLFIGTSHGMYTIDAVTLSERSGTSVYNLCTSAQPIQTTYYLLKESIRTHKEIKRVFFELSISKLVYDEPSQPGTFIVTDYMKSKVARLETIIASFGPEVYVNGFSRLRREFSPTQLTTFSQIADTYSTKKTEEYRNYSLDPKYLGRGQWYHAGWIGNTGEVAVNIESSTLDRFTVDSLKDERIGYIRKIIDLCSENDIELVIFYFPCTEFYLMNFTRYEEITSTVNEIAKEAGVKIIDLNLAKDEYINYDITDYYNPDHLSSTRTGQLTDFFLEYFDDPDGDYFVESLKEKYPVKDYVMYAGYTREVADGEMKVDISAVSYAVIPVYVKLYSLREDNDGNYTVSKEYAPTETDVCYSSFTLPYDKYKTYYRIELYDPDSEKLLYTAYTYFGMD